MNSEEKEKSSLKAWAWISMMLAIILGVGFLAFFVVSDKGQPTWDYRPVKDVPAESPNAEYDLLPNPQHVRGKDGE